MSFFNSIMILTTIVLFTTYGNSIFGTSNRHIINFRSPDFFPVSFARDPTAKRFIVSSSRHPSLISVSDSGTVTTLVSDRSQTPAPSPLSSLPVASFFPNVMVDPIRQRIIATVHSRSVQFRARYLPTPLPSPPPLPRPPPRTARIRLRSRRCHRFLWQRRNYKLRQQFYLECRPSQCQVYTDHNNKRHGPCGLNGIVYSSKGYFLVIQSNTGKLFNVYDENGVAKESELNINLTEIRAIDIKKDGIVLLMSKYKLYFLDSDDKWNKAKVFDEVRLDAKRSPISVTVGGEVVYVLYGHVEEGKIGNSHRNEFSIVGIGPKQHRDFTWIIYMFIGYGSAYFIKQSLKAR